MTLKQIFLVIVLAFLTLEGVDATISFSSPPSTCLYGTTFTLNVLVTPNAARGYVPFIDIFYPSSMSISSAVWEDSQTAQIISTHSTAAGTTSHPFFGVSYPGIAGYNARSYYFPRVSENGDFISSTLTVVFACPQTVDVAYELGTRLVYAFGSTARSTDDAAYADPSGSISTWSSVIRTSVTVKAVSIVPTWGFSSQKVIGSSEPATSSFLITAGPGLMITTLNFNLAFSSHYVWPVSLTASGGTSTSTSSQVSYSWSSFIGSKTISVNNWYVPQTDGVSPIASNGCATINTLTATVTGVGFSGSVIAATTPLACHAKVSLASTISSDVSPLGISTLDTVKYTATVLYGQYFDFAAPTFVLALSPGMVWDGITPSGLGTGSSSISGGVETVTFDISSPAKNTVLTYDFFVTTSATLPSGAAPIGYTYDTTARIDSGLGGTSASSIKGNVMSIGSLQFKPTETNGIACSPCTVATGDISTFSLTWNLPRNSMTSLMVKVYVPSPIYDASSLTLDGGASFDVNEFAVQAGDTTGVSGSSINVDADTDLISFSWPDSTSTTADVVISLKFKLQVKEAPEYGYSAISSPLLIANAFGWNGVGSVVAGSPTARKITYSVPRLSIAAVPVLNVGNKGESFTSGCSGCSAFSSGCTTTNLQSWSVASGYGSTQASVGVVNAVGNSDIRYVVELRNDGSAAAYGVKFQLPLAGVGSYVNDWAMSSSCGTLVSGGTATDNSSPSDVSGTPPVVTYDSLGAGERIYFSFRVSSSTGMLIPDVTSTIVPTFTDYRLSAAGTINAIAYSIVGEPTDWTHTTWITSSYPSLSMSVFSSSLPETASTSVNVGETITIRSSWVFPYGTPVTSPRFKLWWNSDFDLLSWSISSVGGSISGASAGPLTSPANGRISAYSSSLGEISCSSNSGPSCTIEIDAVFLRYDFTSNFYVTNGYDDVTNGNRAFSGSQLFITTNALFPSGIAMSLSPTTGGAGTNFALTATIHAQVGSPGYDGTWTLNIPSTCIKNGATGVSSTPGGTSITVDSESDTQVIVTIPVLPLTTSFTIVVPLKLKDDVEAGKTISVSSTIIADTSPNSVTATDATQVTGKSYQASSGADFTTSGPTVTTPLTLPGFSPIAASPPNVVIGEIFKIRFAIRFPHGITTAFSAILQLPVIAGSLDVLSVISTTETPGSHITFVPSSIVVSDAGGLGGYKERVVWTVPQVTNAPDGATNANDDVVFDVDLVVGDAYSTIIGTRPYKPTFSVEAQHTPSGSSLQSTGLQLICPAGTIQIAVATLQITYTSIQPNGLNAGDSFTLVAQVQHDAQSAAKAFDLSMTYSVPAGMTLTALNINDGAATTSPADPVGQPTITIALPSLALGSKLIVTFTLQLTDLVPLNTAFSHTTSLDYYSRPGTVNDGVISNFHGHKTTISVIQSPSPVSGGITGVTLPYTTDLPDSTGTDLNIGEQITVSATIFARQGVGSYSLTITSSKSTSAEIDLVSAKVKSLPPSTTSTYGVDASLPITVGSNTATINLGSITIPANGNNDDDQIVLDFVFVAKDLGHNTRNNIGSLSCSVTANSASKSATPLNFKIIEPQLAVTRSPSSDITGDAGLSTTINFDVRHTAVSNARAYKVKVTEDVKSYHTLEVGSVTVTNKIGTLVGITVTKGNTVGDTDVEVVVDELDNDVVDAGFRVNYNLILNSNVYPELNFLSNSAVDYDSSPNAVSRHALVKSGDLKFIGSVPGVAFVITSTGFSSTAFTSTTFDALGSETFTLLYTLSPIEGTMSASTVTFVATPAGAITFSSASVTSVAPEITGVSVGQSGTISPDTVVWNVPALVNTGMSVEPGSQKIKFTINAQVGASVAPGTELKVVADFNYGGANKPSKSIGGAVVKAGLEGTSTCNLLGMDPEDPLPLLQAGDRFECTAVISHNGESTSSAFNVHVQADFVGSTHVKLVDDGSAYANNETHTLVPSQGASDGDTRYDLVLPELPLGRKLTTYYVIEVTSSVSPGSSVSPHNFVLTYDTIPGPRQDSDSASLTLKSDQYGEGARPTLAVTFLGTSLSETAAAEEGVEDVNIGEVLNFGASLRPIFGLSSLTLSCRHRYFGGCGESCNNNPDIPATHGNLRLAGVVSSIGTGISGSILGAGQSATGFDLLHSTTDLSGEFDTIKFALGDSVLNIGYESGVDKTIELLFSATPTDRPENVDMVAFDIQCVLHYGLDPEVKTEPITPFKGVMHEPLLVAEHSCVGDAAWQSTIIEAGDAATCTLTVHHDDSSTYPAYHVYVKDYLEDTYIEYFKDSVTFSLSPPDGDISQPEILFGTGDDTYFKVLIEMLPVGSTLTVTYKQRVTSSIRPGETATTLQSAYVGYASAGSGHEHARYYAAEVSFADVLEAYGDVPTITLEVVDTSIEQTPINSGSDYSANIGEVVDFLITINLIQGTNPLEVLIDSLLTAEGAFANLIYKGNVTYIDADVSPATVLDIGADWTSTFSLTFDLGDVVNVGYLNDHDSVLKLELSAVFTADEVNLSKGNNRATWISASLNNIETLPSRVVARLTQPDIEASYSCTPTSDWTTIGAGDTFSCSILASHSALSDSQVAIDVALFDPFQNVVLQLESLDVGSSNLDDVEFTTGVVPGVASSFSVLLPNFTNTGVAWNYTYHGVVNERVTPGLAVTLLRAGIHGTYDTSRGVIHFNQSINPFDMLPDEPFTSTVELPTWSFAISDSTLSDTQSTPDFAYVGIGETLGITFIFRPIDGTCAGKVTFKQNFPAGTNAKATLSAVVNYVDAALTQTAVKEGDVGVGQDTNGDGFRDHLNMDLGSAIVNLGWLEDPANVEEIIIDVSVFVENDAINQNGTVLSYSAVFESGSILETKTISGVINEQFLAYEYSCTPENVAGTHVQSGDVLNCKARVFHTVLSTTTAYDVNITDPVSVPEVALVAGSLTSSRAEATKTSNTGFTTILPSLPLGQEWTVTFKLTVTDKVRPAVDFSPNSISLSYASTDIGVGKTQKASKTVLGAIIFTGKGPIFLRGNVEGLAAVFPGSDNVTMSIGEELSFEYSFQPIEGTNNFTFTGIYTPPSGGVLLNLSASVRALDETLTGSALAVGAKGESSDTNTNSYLDRVALTFGDVVNPYQGTNAFETMNVSLDFYIPDLAVNAPGAQFDTRARARFGSKTGDVLDIFTTITIVQPHLLTNVTRLNPEKLVNAGETFSVIVTLYHAPDSTADAHHIHFSDIFPSTLFDFMPGSASASVGTVVDDDEELLVDIELLPLGETAVVTYSVVLTPELEPGVTALKTSANVTYFTASNTAIARELTAPQGTVEVTARAPTDEVSIFSSSVADTSCTVDECMLSPQEEIVIHALLQILPGKSSIKISAKTPGFPGVFDWSQSSVQVIGVVNSSQNVDHLLNVGDHGVVDSNGDVTFSDAIVSTGYLNDDFTAKVYLVEFRGTWNFHVWNEAFLKNTSNYHRWNNAAAPSGQTPGNVSIVVELVSGIASSKTTIPITPVVPKLAVSLSVENVTPQYDSKGDLIQTSADLTASIAHASDSTAPAFNVTYVIDFSDSRLSLSDTVLPKESFPKTSGVSYELVNDATVGTRQIVLHTDYLPKNGDPPSTITIRVVVRTRYMFSLAGSSTLTATLSSFTTATPITRLFNSTSPVVPVGPSLSEPRHLEFFYSTLNTLTAYGQVTSGDRLHFRVGEALRQAPPFVWNVTVLPKADVFRLGGSGISLFHVGAHVVPSLQSSSKLYQASPQPLAYYPSPGFFIDFGSINVTNAGSVYTYEDFVGFEFDLDVVDTPQLRPGLDISASTLFIHGGSVTMRDVSLTYVEAQFNSSTDSIANLDLLKGDSFTFDIVFGHSNISNFDALNVSGTFSLPTGVEIDKFDLKSCAGVTLASQAVGAGSITFSAARWPVNVTCEVVLTVDISVTAVLAPGTELQASFEILSSSSELPSARRLRHKEFYLVGLIKPPENPCELGTDECVDAECVPAPPYDYTCKCYNGYELDVDGFTCVDIDECALKTHACTDVCVDGKPVNGKLYTCGCNTGRVLLSDGKTCKDLPPTPSTTPDPDCGNGVIDDNEQCDSNTPGCSSCKCSAALGFQAYSPPRIGCALIPEPPVCGDFSNNRPEEECDGGIACDSNCKCLDDWIPSSPPGVDCKLANIVVGGCGDGRVNVSIGEQCDPPLVGGCSIECLCDKNAGFVPDATGIRCRVANPCGNGQLDEGEECDVVSLNCNNCKCDRSKNFEPFTPYRLACNYSTNPTPDLCPDGGTLDLCGKCKDLADPTRNGCVDCAFVPNGPKKLDKCGICRMPSDPYFDKCESDCPDEAATRDLCGQCTFASSASWEYCLGCDDVPFSQWAYDDCGDCSSPVDMSCENNKGCDGVVDSGKKFDVCDRCLLPTSPSFVVNKKDCPPPPTLDIVPQLHCWKKMSTPNGEEIFVAFLGWMNYGDEVTLPIGEKNNFGGLGEVKKGGYTGFRNQPMSFAPGPSKIYPASFQIKWNGDPVVWTLGKRELKFDVKTAQLADFECPDQFNAGFRAEGAESSKRKFTFEFLIRLILFIREYLAEIAKISMERVEVKIKEATDPDTGNQKLAIRITLKEQPSSNSTRPTPTPSSSTKRQSGIELTKELTVAEASALIFENDNEHIFDALAANGLDSDPNEPPYYEPLPAILASPEAQPIGATSVSVSYLLLLVSFLLCLAALV